VYQDLGKDQPRGVQIKTAKKNLVSDEKHCQSDTGNAEHNNIVSAGALTTCELRRYKTQPDDAMTATALALMTAPSILFRIHELIE
jgi:hypothetical protein